MKKDIENQIVIGYRNHSTLGLYEARKKSLEQGYYDLARKAVKCIDRLVNPFTFY